jgi:hypothetical protein
VPLDQDSAHPRKPRRTRRTVRHLHLHYISLPKGCPDGNPVETLFSPVQTGILDTSNDPEAKTTQRRISVYLRGTTVGATAGFKCLTFQILTNIS